MHYIIKPHETNLSFKLFTTVFNPKEDKDQVHAHLRRTNGRYARSQRLQRLISSGCYDVVEALQPEPEPTSHIQKQLNVYYDQKNGMWRTWLAETSTSDPIVTGYGIQPSISAHEFVKELDKFITNKKIAIVMDSKEEAKPKPKQRKYVEAKCDDKMGLFFDVSGMYSENFPHIKFDDLKFFYEDTDTEEENPIIVTQIGTGENATYHLAWFEGQPQVGREVGGTLEHVKSYFDTYYQHTYVNKY
jgi:hypothetical protein